MNQRDVLTSSACLLMQTAFESFAQEAKAMFLGMRSFLGMNIGNGIMTYAE